MKYKWLYFLISLVVIIPGTYSLLRYGLRLSIDFTGGSLVEVSFPKSKPASGNDVADVARSQGLEVSSVQPTGDNAYILRLKPITQEQNEQFKQQLIAKYEQVTENRFETVGPVVGAELARKSVIAVAIASIAIVVYIAWSFRRIPAPYSSWKFGASAVAALLHDVVLVLGVFSLFGRWYNVEIDALFVTALLTVIGFSVHDTIVVFDRVRENLPKMAKATFEQVVDFSLTETLTRSLNTSITVILTLTALLLFGGETIRWFVAALLIGIVSGTYSSIFNASPLLALWESKKSRSK